MNRIYIIKCKKIINDDDYQITKQKVIEQLKEDISNGYIFMDRDYELTYINVDNKDCTTFILESDKILSDDYIDIVRSKYIDEIKNDIGDGFVFLPACLSIKFI